MGQQLFPEIMRTLLAATIGVENAAEHRVMQPHRHIQSTDGQILFHPVACSPPDHTTTEQIDDDSQVEPALGRPDRTDIACPFLVEAFSKEVAVQKVGHNVRLVVAVGRDLVRRVRTGRIPLSFMRRPTRRSPTSSPTYLSSMVMRGRP